MKMTLIAAMCLSFSGAAFATCQQSCGAAVIGGNSISSGSAAHSVSSGTGSSTSFASNSAMATTSVDAVNGIESTRFRNDAGGFDKSISGYTGVSGHTMTQSESVAYNVSSGHASGGAAAHGSADAFALGAGGFAKRTSDGEISGRAGGLAFSHSENSVVAGRNEGGYVGSMNASGFKVDATASLSSSSDCKYCRANEDVKNLETSVLTYSNSLKVIGGIPNLGQADISNSNYGIATGFAKAGAEAMVKDYEFKSYNPQSKPEVSGQNNGHGNGDQDAPGKSGPHNNAENSEHSGQGNSRR